MSSVALLCRNCLKLSSLSSWRQANVRATLPTITTTSAAAPIRLLHSSKAVIRLQQYPSQRVRLYQTFRVMDTPPHVFRGVVDRFKGVTVDSQEEALAGNAQFQEKLEKSLAFWTTNANRAIWFRVHKPQASWVPILTDSGFDFHHTRNGAVIMYRWLPTHESSNLPHYAHTLLGVGGLVVNDQQQVLVVSDRYAMIPNSWKLPGGYVEPRENFIDAAIREVQEETGICTTFQSVICLRHTHGGNFGCSDIYMVISLKPLNLDFQRCEREIMRVQWMPVEEFLQHPQVHETNRHFMRTYLDYQQRGLTLTCRQGVHQILKKEFNLYFIDEAKDGSEANQVPG
ncbi:CG8128 [Drosophila busckii]|uniref:CG8128 n=1 Tax=Drosophila busckii TaxID=30019 RepID=A0A0M3QZL5_DROBS|nr:nudix hydrolase 2 [Drosophila busckii]ALC49589.1 CG8128 [Drosophila busckii]